MIKTKISSDVNYDKNYNKAFNNILGKTDNEIKEQLNLIIDNIYSGIMPKGNQVVLKDVPNNLQKLGIHNRPMLMSPKEIRNAILSKQEAIELEYPHGKGDNYHQLGKDTFYKVLNCLNDPVMIIKENLNKIIVFTEQFDYKKNQIIVPIEINTLSNYNEMRVNDVNVIKSMHGRTSINNYINNLVKKDITVIYKNLKKIQSIDGCKVQYPESINSVSAKNSIINN